MQPELSEAQLSRMSEFVACKMGLDFPPERWAELHRGVAAAAEEIGFHGAAACAEAFCCAQPPRIHFEVLAANLTIGETYFFRDPKSFEILAEKLIPAIAAARQAGQRRLRIWSAACCTGEEAYSIAIVLRRSIPDLADWNVTLLATDINSRFLRKAAAGVFGDWSFRDAPPWLKENYFRPVGDRQWEIAPAIRQMVRFAYLNLAEDVYPSLANDTNAMDIIFCRNVLMYFTADQMRKVVENLYRAQITGGWLIVGTTEYPQLGHMLYEPADIAGALILQKKNGEMSGMEMPQTPVNPEPVSTTLAAQTPASAPPPDSIAQAKSWYQKGWYAKAAVQLQALALADPRDAEVFSLLARSLANQGKLAEAAACCDDWLAADKFNASAHYLRAVVLQEQGQFDEAVRSLRNVLYLQPHYVLAHFALGNIARDRGRLQLADKHLRTALQLLRGSRPDDVVPGSDGVTAQRLAKIIGSLTQMRAAA